MKLLSSLSPLTLAVTLALSGCMNIPVSESNLLGGRKAELISDRIVRSNLELTLPDAPGQSLHGWHLKHPAPKATLVYFYGGGGSLWNSGRHLHEIAQQLEVDVVAYDVRGSGASGGKPSFAAVRADALRIFDAARRPDLPTLVMGYSLGSVSAIHLAANRPVDGLAVLAGVSSFADAQPAFEARVPWYAKPFVKLEIEPVFHTKPQPVDEMARVKAPTFLIHGDADEQLPVVCGDRLAEANKASWKRYQRLNGIGHGNLPLFNADNKAALQSWVMAAQKVRQVSAP
ncbi:hypothetical protein HNQ51_002297 [Inhella inkyongensis]|uniref:Serine aminopeptidase S33 domain-containing protein n=1 Tax=Inhella inkyongensis TaxID=392593 RepID=A0A840S639_9BURK|nr:alpha/beta fold hydrolase [Inhella inkyongensis]MBB5204978.1 hypothetical protein [Inhella inkyongensis]